MSLADTLQEEAEAEERWVEPGTREACAAGCPCSVYFNHPDPDKRLYNYQLSCPVHGSLVNSQ